MPTYSFQNIKTGEIFEESMKIAELDPYLKKHKNIKQIFIKVNIGDPWRLGVSKPPSDFSKYVLGRMKSAIPGAKVEEGKYHIPKEI